jgi:hypothetical protein
MAEPSSVWKTTLAVEPLVPSSSASTPVTRSVSVPGIENELTRVPPKARNAPAASPSTTTQETMASQARRAAPTPMR